MTLAPVCISGLGVVCGAGDGVRSVAATLRGGVGSPGPVELFPTTLTCPVFQVQTSFADTPSSAPSGEQPTELSGHTGSTAAATALGRPNRCQDNAAPSLSRTCLLAIRAANEALTEAGNPHLKPGFRLGVCLGTTVASQLNNLPFYDQFRRTGRPPMQPVIDYLRGNLAEVVARAAGANGPRTTVVNACSSGTEAIGLAMSWLRAGLCDAAIAGGADELNLVPFCGFHSLGVMSDQQCRPFDRNRRGLNLGEGAGVLMLETIDSARRRGRQAELMVVGYGAACDAYHLTAPHPQGRGLEQAIAASLKQAGMNPADIAFANAHGTATPDNDRIEGAVLERVFGGHLPFVSTKGYTGHTLGAAGGLEAVFTALALREGWLPANAGFAEPDPDIHIAPLTETSTVAGDAAISTSLAFGGNNAALVLRRQKSPPAPVGRTSSHRRRDEPGMAIRSIGLVGSCGRGIENLEQAVLRGWQPPTEQKVPGLRKSVKGYAVAPEWLVDRSALKQMRRADRFCKLAALAAHDTLNNSGKFDPRRLGIVVATGLGPHVRTFEFLDGILDYGDTAVSPTAFSHSVHNAAASYIAEAWQISGPVQTLTDFEFAFPQALQVARNWLSEEQVDAVLLGVVEELGQVMMHTCGRLLRIPDDGRMRPLAFAPEPLAVPGEGALFFLLARPEKNRTSSPSPLSLIHPGLPATGIGPDLTILDANGLGRDETDYLRLLPQTGVVANYSPLFGTMSTGLAWQCAVAALCVQQQKFYATPLPQSSHIINCCRTTRPGEINTIHCHHLGVDGTAASVAMYSERC